MTQSRSIKKARQAEIQSRLYRLTRLRRECEFRGESCDFSFSDSKSCEGHGSPMRQWCAACLFRAVATYL